MPITYVITAASLAAMFVLLGFLLARRAILGAPERKEAEQRTNQLQVEVASLREEKAAIATRLAVEEQKSSRLPTLEKELAEQKNVAESLVETKGIAERDLAAAREALTRMDAAFLDMKNRLSSAEASLETARNDIGELRAGRATLQETLEQERKQSDAKLSLLNDAKEQMTTEFKVLANSVMKEHGENFTKQNKDQIDNILSPLNQKIIEFQQGLQNAHTESAKERATLAEQIRKLSEDSVKMTFETSSLTRALKGEAQTQGAWGEMILASILERSGLREGEEYVVQENYTTEEGNRLRSDVVVNLPGGQRIVIDSKVSLVAFTSYVNAETEVERAASLGSHLASMRSHIKTLGSKEYHTAAGSQLDYVVMFVPNEGALYAAVQADPNLTSFAFENNVAIATPTTLMIALRTIANVWQVEIRNRNAEQIALRAGRIYDKLTGFLEDMSSLGNRLGQARSSFDDAIGKLSSGRGNLVQQVEHLKTLGAKTNKSLPENMLDGSETLLIEEESTSVKMPA